MTNSLKISRLALIFVTIIIFGSINLNGWWGSPGDPPPVVCFELDLRDCPNAASANLKINRFAVRYIQTPSGSVYEVLDIVETKTEPVVPITEKYVKGFRHGCWGGSGNVSASYRDLFYHEFRRWPTPTELANILQSDAENWFKDKFQNPCWGFGPQYARVDNGLEYRTKGGPICFDYPDPLLGFNNYNPKIMPFEMEVVFPNGQKCKIESVYFASVQRPKNGEKIVSRVRVIQPCAGCY